MRVEEVLQNRKYERLEETFRIAPIEDWSVVPDDLRPGKVPTNTVYHAMVSGPDGRVMLELQASPGGGMRVWRMSPTIDPVELQPESFQRFISGSPYLIIVNGSLYFCSSKRSQKDREGFRRSLFQPPSAAGRKKKR